MELEQFGPGLYEVPYEMPCKPSDIRVHRYDLNLQIVNAEGTEAAARVLSYSYGDRWLAVSLNRIEADLRKELEVWNEFHTQYSQDAAKKFVAEHMMRRYNALTAFTLGLGTLFLEKPQSGIVIRPKRKLVTTLARFGGLFPILDGVLHLHREGYLDTVQEEDEAVLFPTPALV
jgi:hypothetical protein